MTRQHYGPVLTRHPSALVIDCQGCRFAHVDPLPTQETVDALYREAYYATEKPRYLTEFEEDEAWWRLVYRERLEMLEQMLRNGWSVIDVGSGPGGFLAVAESRGWSTLGIEPSAQAVEYSRRRFKVDVMHTTLSKACDRVNTVDAIHLSEVLEHVPDPRETLREVRALLNPKGVVCVVVPNDYNPLQLALNATAERPNWWVEPRHHLNYFTVQSLHELLSGGFEVQHTTTTFPMELFLMMGADYVGHPDVGRACHDRRKRLELALDALGFSHQKSDWYRLLGQYGLGRELVMYARRTN